MPEESMKPRVPACMRTGMCCETILLSHSPRTLRESYERWFGKRSDEGTKFDHIYLIYPMLLNRCRGKFITENGHFRYVYGPCRNLDHDAQGLPTCAIHDNRPSLCRGYPDYDKGTELKMGVSAGNPGYMRGCGYNEDPKVGLSASEMKIDPLADDEK